MDRRPAAEAVVVRSYLGPGDERSLADDVLDGLTRPFKELPPKHFYDARGARALRPHHASCPSTTRRAPSGRSSRRAAPRRSSSDRRRRARRARLGDGDEDAVLLRALHDAGTLRRYVPIDVTEATGPRDGRASSSTSYPGLRVHGIVGDFERHLATCPPPLDGPRVVAFLGGTIGNFPPGSRRRFLRATGAAAAAPASTACCSAPTSSRTPRRLEAAYNDSRGRHGRVQPQRAARDQPRARRRLRRRRLRARRLLRPRARVDRDAPARAARAWTSTSARSTSTSPSPRARRCAPRSARSSRRERLRGRPRGGRPALGRGHDRPGRAVRAVAERGRTGSARSGARRCASLTATVPVPPRP